MNKNNVVDSENLLAEIKFSLKSLRDFIRSHRTRRGAIHDPSKTPIWGSAGRPAPGA